MNCLHCFRLVDVSGDAYARRVNPKIPAPTVNRYRVLLIAFIAACSAMFAQVDTGSISGLVRDPSGAGMPGVQLTICEVTRCAISNARSGETAR
jgi:hypothetical protein